MRQNLRSGEVDLITAGELGAELHKHIGDALSRIERRHVEGIKLTELPLQQVNPATSFFMLQNQPPARQCGPESGFLWMVTRCIVSSNVGGDQATYQLYKSSDTSTFQNPGTGVFAPPPTKLVEGFTSQPTVTNSLSAGPAAVAIILGANGVAAYNNNAFPVNANVTGGTVTAIAVNGVTTGSTSGNFYIPAGGSITVTYSVAPTLTTTAIYGGVTQTNSNGVPVYLSVSGGTVNSIWVNGGNTGLTSGNFYLAPDATYSIGYTAAPTVSTSIANPSGRVVNTGYYPGNRTLFLQPGEILIPMVLGGTNSANAQYYFTGTAISVPAELIGKLIA